MDVVLELVTTLPDDALVPLVAESEREGLRFVRRLADDWTSGTNRFDRPGERLYVARHENAIVGVCGLNVDPFTDDALIGRVRRLYVLPAFRRLGIGGRLLKLVIAAAGGQFHLLRVRTENTEAAKLYERFGFQPTAETPDCTHTLQTV